MTNISVWGFKIPYNLVCEKDKVYLINLPKYLPTVEWIWQEMDRVWYLLGLDNGQPPLKQLISDYYCHPVWLMNGIFTALDPVSKLHRKAIAIHLSKTGFKTIADYGGGFGELALTIADTIPEGSISIIEPYPSKVALDRLSNTTRVNFSSQLDFSGYDVVIAQDVLEHIEDPIELAYQLAEATHVNGQVIFANCFYPVIQCHLPITFHLRYTFFWIMKAMGLQYIGKVRDAEHAFVFERIGELNIKKARQAETISKLVGPMINTAQTLISRIKKLIFV
jgi:2-polyprenyl-3-methyl-5-hydroxy-6-metoxy-1,4-benzoquinol methylase